MFTGIKRLFKLPKEIVNSHVHARDLEESHKTTLLQTLLEAFLAGVRYVCAMPNTSPSISGEEVKENYLALAEHSIAQHKLPIKFRLWFGQTDYNLTACKLALKDHRVPGLKFYPLLAGGKAVTTGKCGVADWSNVEAGMRAAYEADKVYAVHGADPAIFAAEGGCDTIRGEISCDERIIDSAKKFPGIKISICHVSCRESAELILRAQDKGMRIAIEICAQYLWFDDQGTNRRPGLQANFYKCLNALRSPEDRKYLVSLLPLGNPLIYVSADHAPHTSEEKLAGAGGIPSLFETVPVVLTHAVDYGIGEEQVANLLSFNASDHLGLGVSREMEEVELIKRPDKFVYNNGIVVNPWLGSELYFPIRDSAV
jgi:dihydroorotase